MMTPHRQRQIIFPECNQPVIFFFTIFKNIQVDFRSLPIYEPGNMAAGIKGFGIGQIIYQLDKVFGHFVGIPGWLLLHSLPPVFILFNKQGFPQNQFFGL